MVSIPPVWFFAAQIHSSERRGGCPGISQSVANSGMTAIGPNAAVCSCAEVAGMWTIHRPSRTDLEVQIENDGTCYTRSSKPSCDSFGRPLRFPLAAGQSHDILAAPTLLQGYTAEAVLADRAYDSNALRSLIADIGAKAVIPSTRSRSEPIPHDPIIYRCRNRIERCFNKLKHFRRFATRHDRRAIYFLGFIHLAAAMIWMR